MTLQDRRKLVTLLGQLFRESHKAHKVTLLNHSGHLLYALGAKVQLVEGEFMVLEG